MHDVFVTVTQASKALSLTKQETLELIEKYRIRKIKAFPDDVRFVVSMRDLNLVMMKKIKD